MNLLEHQPATRARTVEATRQTRTSASLQPPLLTRPPLHPILQLQQALGNQAFGRLIQAKLAISDPGDTYEQEADRVAERIVQMKAAAYPCGQAGSTRQGDDSLQCAVEQPSGPTGLAVPALAPRPHQTVYLSSTPMIQRDTTGAQAAPAITAQTVFPFPRGSRVVLNRIMSDDWFDRLSSLQPELGAAMRAIDRQAATVTTAGDDLFEATLTDPVSLPAQGGNPARTLSGVTLSLRRQPAGTFDFELSGRTDPQASPTILFEQRNLTARQEEGGIILSSGAEPQLRTSPGAAGQVRIEAFTAPYLSQVPELVRGIVPQRLELFQLTRLQGVRSGTAAEQEAISRIASEVAGQRRERRQRLLVGGGVQAGAQLDPLLAASWQISFTPVQVAGGLFQVPLEMQVQYAPSSSLLGGISTGAESSLSQFNIPVNIRLVAGLAGGTIQGVAPGTGVGRPVHPAFGFTLGAGVGLELDAFRVDLRYEHLFNLVEASPDADSLFGRLGWAF